MLIKINNNPQKLLVGDCVIRAISTVLNQTWEQTYVDICDLGLKMADMPSANRVWGRYLRDKGFVPSVLPECPDCYSIKDFCEEHRNGTYVLGTGTHVIAVIDGDYYDTWNSGDEIPIYYWEEQ